MRLVLFARKKTMTRATIAGGAIATVLILLALALAAALWVREQDVDRAAAPSSAITPSTGPAASEACRSFLYGRLTTNDGAAYEGRLRWGGDEEAFWGDYFNGFKARNPWVGHVPPEQLKESWPLEIFGFEIAQWESQIDLGRPFMARFGEHRANRGEGPRPAGDSQERDRLPPRPFRCRRLRRRHASVGR